VNSRMARAGLKGQTVISPQLLEELHYRAQGIPRVINAICDNLLLTAFAMESRIATLAMLDEVVADMRLEYPGQRPFRADPDFPQRTLRRT
jgi:general secretion pathway protein A